MYDPIIEIIDEIPIIGITIGSRFKRSELIKTFPFLDISNQDYFKEVYEDKFKVGDRVLFTGKIHTYTSYNKIKSNHTYVITDVNHKMWNQELKTTYAIRDVDNKNLEFAVKEDELELSKEKWIISFSSYGGGKGEPGVVQLDYGSWLRKIQYSNKDKFVFDTQEEAKKYAEMFGQFTLDEMYNSLKKSKHWHKMSEKLPPRGGEVLIAMKNKNMEDGIWLYDIATYCGGDVNESSSWDNKINYEVPLYWKYIDNPE